MLRGSGHAPMRVVDVAIMITSMRGWLLVLRRWLFVLLLVLRPQLMHRLPSRGRASPGEDDVPLVLRLLRLRLALLAVRPVRGSECRRLLLSLLLGLGLGLHFFLISQRVYHP